MHNIDNSQATYTILNKYLETDTIQFNKTINKYGTKDISVFIGLFENSRSFGKLVNTLNADILSSCILELRTKTISKIIKNLHIDKTAKVLKSINHEKRKQILCNIPKNLVEEINEIIDYPENTAGSILTTNILVGQEEESIKDILKKIKRQKSNIFNYVYLIDIKENLKGVISISELIKNPINTVLKDLPIKYLPTLSTMSPKEDITEITNKFKLEEIPIINNQQQFIGVVRGHSLIETLQEDAISKIQIMSGSSKEEQALSSPWFATKKRLPWLNINLLTVFAAASVIAMFEGIISKYTSLAILLPVVAGQSGNTGAQSLAVVMRGLTLKEIRLKHWLAVSIKEFISGIINGTFIGTLAAISVYFWSNSIGLTIVTGTSMVFVMAIASVSGAIVPMLLRFFKQDPAQSSSIILTTITDISGFLIFLGFAYTISKFIPLN